MCVLAQLCLVPEEQPQLEGEECQLEDGGGEMRLNRPVEFVMQTLIKAYRYQFASFPGPHHFRLHDHEEPFLRAAENGTGLGTRIGTSIIMCTLGERMQ